MSFRDRLLSIIKFSGKNTTNFGKQFNSMSSENIRQLSKKDNPNPPLLFLEEILQLYPEINSHWLLTGEGDMLNTPTNYKNTATGFDMVNEHGEGVCYKCYAKDGQINLLEKQVSEKDATIATLNKTIGKLQNKLDNCGCDNGKNAHSA